VPISSGFKAKPEREREKARSQDLSDRQIRLHRSHLFFFLFFALVRATEVSHLLDDRRGGKKKKKELLLGLTRMMK
jgi:hypothetical protein